MASAKPEVVIGHQVLEHRPTGKIPRTVTASMFLRTSSMKGKGNGEVDL